MESLILSRFQTRESVKVTNYCDF